MPTSDRSRLGFGIIAFGLFAGCATTYEPVTTGPSSTLSITQAGAEGLLAVLTLYIRTEEQDLGGKQIEDDTPFTIPAGEPLELTLSYRNQVVFGSTLSGSRTMLLTPREGASYLINFWNDNESFRVDLAEQRADGLWVRVPQSELQSRNYAPSRSRLGLSL